MESISTKACHFFPVSIKSVRMDSLSIYSMRGKWRPAGTTVALIYECTRSALYPETAHTARAPNFNMPGRRQCVSDSGQQKFVQLNNLPDSQSCSFTAGQPVHPRQSRVPPPFRPNRSNSLQQGQRFRLWINVRIDICPPVHSECSVPARHNGLWMS